MNAEGPDSDIEAIYDFHDDWQLGEVLYNNWISSPFENTPPTPPGTPIHIDATAPTGTDDDSRLDFTWNASWDDAALDHYNVYVSVNGGPFILATTTQTDSVTITGRDGHTYSIRIEAVDTAGKTSWPSAASRQIVVQMPLKWQPTGGPIGGQIKALALSDNYSVDHTVFAAGLRGIWRSVDNGTNWTFHLREAEVNAFAASGSTIYAGGGGLWRSIDGGDTWQRLGFAGGGIHALAMLGPDVYVGATGGLYRSSDDGATWDLLLDEGIYSVAASGTTIFAGTHSSGGGLHRSVDGGNTWESVGFAGDEVVALVISGSTVFAGMEKQVANGGVWRSLDNGDTWTHVLSDVKGFSLGYSDSTVYVATSDNLYRSLDDGDTWTQVMSAGLSIRQVATSGPHVFTGSLWAGVFRSVDGGDNWSQVPLPAQVITALFPFGTSLLTSTPNSGILRSEDSGATWNAVTPSGTAILDFTSWESTLYAAVAWRQVFSSTNSGIDWSLVGVTCADGRYAFDLAVNGTILFAGIGENQYSNGAICRSTDGGQTWEQVWSGAFVYDVAFSDAAVFAGSANGVLRSLDGGDNWQQVLDAHVTTLVISDTTLFAGTRSGGVFRSLDNGDTWTQAGLEGQTVELASTGWIHSLRRSPRRWSLLLRGQR